MYNSRSLKVEFLSFSCFRPHMKRLQWFVYDQISAELTSVCKWSGTLPHQTADHIQQEDVHHLLCILASFWDSRLWVPAVFCPVSPPCTSSILRLEVLALWNHPGRRALLMLLQSNSRHGVGMQERRDHSPHQQDVGASRRPDRRLRLDLNYFQNQNSVRTTKEELHL